MTLSVGKNERSNPNAVLRRSLKVSQSFRCFRGLVLIPNFAKNLPQNGIFFAQNDRFFKTREPWRYFLAVLKSRPHPRVRGGGWVGKQYSRVHTLRRNTVLHTQTRNTSTEGAQQFISLSQNTSGRRNFKEIVECYDTYQHHHSQNKIHT